MIRHNPVVHKEDTCSEKEKQKNDRCVKERSARFILFLQRIRGEDVHVLMAVVAFFSFGGIKLKLEELHHFIILPIMMVTLPNMDYFRTIKTIGVVLAAGIGNNKDTTGVVAG
jgi:hypothetical protein